MKNQYKVCIWWLPSNAMDELGKIVMPSYASVLKKHVNLERLYIPLDLEILLKASDIVNVDEINNYSKAFEDFFGIAILAMDANYLRKSIPNSWTIPA